jgi:hypothetical protein
MKKEPESLQRGRSGLDVANFVAPVACQIEQGKLYAVNGGHRSWSAHPSCNLDGKTTMFVANRQPMHVSRYRDDFQEQRFMASSHDFILCLKPTRTLSETTYLKLLHNLIPFALKEQENQRGQPGQPTSRTVGNRHRKSRNTSGMSISFSKKYSSSFEFTPARA